MSLKIHRVHAPQPSIPVPEGSIKKIAAELVERCIFWTDLQSKENTRLVCHLWNTITLSASKHPRQKEIEDFIRLLIKNLTKKHPHKRAKLAEIKDMLKSLSPFLATPAQTERLFLITKGYVLGVLQTLSPTRRNRLQSVVCLKIPSPLNDLFVLTQMNLEKSIKTGNFEIFYMILHRCLPLSPIDHLRAIMTTAGEGHFKMLRSLLAQGIAPRILSPEERGTEVVVAYQQNHQDCAQLLLDNGPISKNQHGAAVRAAAYHNNAALIELLCDSGGPVLEVFLGEAILNAIAIKKPELARFLLTKGTISGNCLGPAVKEAAKNNDIALVSLLLQFGPIPLKFRGEAVLAAAEHDNFEIVELLLAAGSISQSTRGEAVRIAAFHNNIKLARLLLNSGLITEKYLGRAITVAALHDNPELTQLLMSQQWAPEKRDNTI